LADFFFPTKDGCSARTGDFNDVIDIETFFNEFAGKKAAAGLLGYYMWLLHNEV
jgi:hypothetical protein